MKKRDRLDISNMIYATSLGLQLGLVVVIPLSLCLLAGLWMDRKFGSSPFFLVGGVISGGIIAYREVYSLIRPLIGK